MTRIIVVEDDLIQQEMLLTFLAHIGHDAKGVDNGVALDLCLQQFTPEIILLDYNLPGESGVELARRLRTSFGLSVGIVMITARSHSTDRIECRRAGVDSYLVKPIDFDEMLAVIDHLLLRLNPLTTQTWKLLLARSELLSPDGQSVALVNSEVLLLAALAGAFQHKASRESLIRALGKNPAAYDPRALETCISRLRHKLASDECNPLQAIRGSGYQFTRPLLVI